LSLDDAASGSTGHQRLLPDLLAGPAPPPRRSGGTAPERKGPIVVRGAGIACSHCVATVFPAHLRAGGR
jgi:hypothetical protein